VKNVLIIEHSTSKLTLNEGASSKKNPYVLGGIFTEFNVTNRNDRIYSADNFLAPLAELVERIDSLGVYGEMDHPDTFDVSLDRASHLIKKAYYVSEKSRVDGVIHLTPHGKGREARALVDEGFPLFVSSRAAGVTESTKSVKINKLFTYDLVADPGFGSARMNSMNESLGFKNTANFRIYEMKNDTDVNNLFDMNKNDIVTKTQLNEYSAYISEQIKKNTATIKGSIKDKNLDSKKLSKVQEELENLYETQAKLIKYLDYLVEHVQTGVNKIEKVEETTKNLIKHNDYIVENLEKNIDETNMVSEKMNQVVEYADYVAGGVNTISETTDNLITHNNYIAEKLNKNIKKTAKVIEYAEYVAGGVDEVNEKASKIVDYSEYLAEKLSLSIDHSDHIVENVLGNMEYQNYIAEKLDKSIQLSSAVIKTLNESSVITENKGGASVPTLEDFGFHDDFDYEDEDEDTEEDEDFLGLPEAELKDIKELEGDVEELEDDLSDFEQDLHEEDGDLDIDAEDEDFEDLDEDDNEGDEFFESSKSTNNFQLKIDELISEARKRTISEKTDNHFLTFISESKRESYEMLTEDEKEKIKIFIEGKSYYCEEDVLNYMVQALRPVAETLTEKLMRTMPKSVLPVWAKLNEASQKSIIAQAKLYPGLDKENSGDSLFGNFWETRNLRVNKPVSKLVEHQALIDDEEQSAKDIEQIMERMRNL
jgi:uncharacterized protein YoxC